MYCSSAVHPTACTIRETQLKSTTLINEVNSYPYFTDHKALRVIKRTVKKLVKFYFCSYIRRTGFQEVLGNVYSILCASWPTRAFMSQFFSRPARKMSDSRHRYSRREVNYALQVVDFNSRDENATFPGIA